MPRHGVQLIYLPTLYQIKFAKAKLLVSSPCQIKILEGQTYETRVAPVAISDDGERVVAQEWNRDRIA